MGADQLEELFSGAKKVVAAKGKKVVVIDMAKDEDAMELLEANALGPTGNLRAPTLRVGKNWLVGFNEDEYGKVIS
jgi:arsenate reductase-like glutaredoxin family protein